LRRKKGAASKGRASKKVFGPEKSEKELVYPYPLQVGEREKGDITLSEGKRDIGVSMKVKKGTSYMIGGKLNFLSISEGKK